MVIVQDNSDHLDCVGFCVVVKVLNKTSVEDLCTFLYRKVVDTARDGWDTNRFSLEVACCFESVIECLPQ